MLRQSDFTIDLLRQIPIDGPWSPSQLRRLAHVGFRDTVAFVRQLPIDEPLSDKAVRELASVGYADALERIGAVASRTDGPLSLRQALNAVRPGS